MTIRFENISYAYNTKLPQKNQVLKNINLEISSGEFVGIIGPAGSGKTTLLQHFTGLLEPSAGRIFVDGKDIWSNNYPLHELRKRIGLVFQFPETQLFEETVYDDVAFGPTRLKLPAAEIEHRVKEALKLVGMTEASILDRAPYQLSEGEKRRVAIAGVLAMAPEMLVLDEPTACLDPAGTRLVVNMLSKLHENGTTIVMITHNMDVILQLVQRIIILNQGEIIFDGSKEAVFSRKELLQSVELEVPRIVRLSRYLQQLEILPQRHIFSLTELKREIKILK